MIPIIFDTDMDIDCDDAGALAVLHALMDNEEAQILGVICDVPSRNSAYVVQAINKYYNRSKIPIGIVKDDTFETSEKYRNAREQGMTFKGYYPPIIVQEFGNLELNEQKIINCVSLYRKLLTKSKSNSVVIVAVGLLTALAQLMVSESDRITSLMGIQLIKKKVKKLVTMGMGSFPEGNAEFNWLLDWNSAQRVINHWPIPLVVSTLGSQFRTGKRLSKTTPITNPVRRCYEIYMNGQKRGNYRWDLIAAYHGVREQNPYFEEVKGHYIHLKQYIGKSNWMVARKNLKKHSHLRLKSSKVAAKKELEELLLKLPKD